ncbi:hypothetical protein AB0V79_02295 [Mesorhizobium ciceri]|jgi:hypothetical protein|uniref:Uncharacterized protein n=5 Tax=Mesorhizobium TaxID=68287 RepID=E8TBW2_MESCW|nr:MULTISPECIES: hypothetical protein [Mesorhizobium]RUV47475.1 hypothetical protein EOB77_27930 [Mesorhizobium sp. M7A.F.Ca.MR.228.00.0.0]RUX74895.1 hypothetical protein EN990_15985 [Mesorhizobium sp. M7A.F.Ca.US.005.03.1.1]RVA54463.1 hypothetical protein EN933_10350 [Mesorhizobium sp. M7A.F.Ca.US.001.01.1.1]RVB47544.1 hypothetical protein EN918_02530 [Mesorhizobium sp. M7A.F.Ca.CA.004.05.1.1]RVC21012.1 hypothetical protein EN879_24200 [Mesorhizobium sp. M7A.F.Ca.AU.002.02.1.1]
MDAMAGLGSVPAPTHQAKEFLAYETECRNVLKPLLAGLLDMAEAAGWNRRTAASALMFLAAQQVSATSEVSAGSG